MAIRPFQTGDEPIHAQALSWIVGRQGLQLHGVRRHSGAVGIEMLKENLDAGINEHPLGGLYLHG